MLAFSSATPKTILPSILKVILLKVIIGEEERHDIPTALSDIVLLFIVALESPVLVTPSTVL